MFIKVSIIIATYNSESNIRICLDNIISQTFQNWECVVVDGKSKDNTVDIVKEYVQKDSRIRYISEKVTMFAVGNTNRPIGDSP